MIGQVYKAHSDKYLVKSGNETYNLSARGVLKFKSEGISVGDYVEFDKNSIIRVLERKSHFIRPNVSNVDLIVAVISPEPKPDYYLIDKLLISAIKENVEFVLVVNKTDVDDTLIDQIKKEYLKLNLNAIPVCAKTGRGIEELKTLLSGKFAVFAGQSAVGKTSLINTLFNLNLKTGDLSEKISRGKHTTTRSEIFEVGDVKVIDSPGFAVLDAFVTADELCEYYPDYFENSGGCKFRGCKHVSEPQCKVKEMVENGELSLGRYQRYIEIYNELLKRREIYEKD